MAINQVSGALGSLLSQGVSSSATAAKGQGSGFADMLTEALSSTMGAQKDAARIAEAVASGQNVPTSDVIAAISKAEMTLQTMVTVRDRAVEAYQQIIQMHI